MEIYLLAALVLIYIITVFMIPGDILRKLWLSAFLAAGFMCTVALGFFKISNQEVMMSASELSWYYILYVFASLTVVLGVINLWLFRKSLLKTLFASYDDDDTEDI
ncbi:MAG: hypothetical protein IJ689_02910 [Alphaproteobacteria bacterium]|nr:hypothetical protein [Alphaproteobacteria bacterium]